jgi:outer membrane lipoprotein-sorting protein
MRVARYFICIGLGLVLSTTSAFAAGDLKTSLARLDAAAAKFKSTSADFEFNTSITDPIPDTEVQKGTAYYQRKGSTFQMAAHIREVNGKKVPKTYVYSDGKLKLHEPLINQVTVLSGVTQYEGYLMLGFGASGKELAEKWNITDEGPETINGVQTQKLELVPKDPKVLKNLPKVILWIDLERGVSIRQFFDQGQGQTRTCNYSNIKMNESLPGDAFTIKTDSKTQFINR